MSERGKRASKASGSNVQAALFQATVQAPAVQAPAVQAPAVQAPAVQATAVQATAVQATAVQATAVQAHTVETQVSFYDQTTKPGKSRARLNAAARAILDDSVPTSRARLHGIGDGSNMIGHSPKVDKEAEANFREWLNELPNRAAAEEEKAAAERLLLAERGETIEDSIARWEAKRLAVCAISAARS